MKKSKATIFKEDAVEKTKKVKAPIKEINKKPEKKKGGCGKCLLTSLIVFVVLVCGVYGGAVWAWGHFLQPKVGITLNQAFGLVGTLYKADEKKIVTNPYNSEQESINFYNNLKSKLYLNANVNLSIEDILSGALGGGGTAPATPAGVTIVGTEGYDRQYFDKDGQEIDRHTAYSLIEQSVVAKTAAGDGSTFPPADGSITPPVDGTTPPPTPPATGTGNAALDKLLEELKFDFSSLENYTGASNILELSDKSFAAIIDEGLKALYKVPAISDQVTSILGKDAFSFIKVEQVIISNSDSVHIESAQMKITLSLQVKEMASGLLSSKIPNAFLQKAIKVILPKMLYFTVSAYPYDLSRGMDIAINEMDKEKADQTFKVIDAFAGENFAENMMIDMNKKVATIIDKVNQIIPLSFVNSGCTLQPIQGLLNMLKLSISEGQFLTLIRDIELPTLKSLHLDGFTDELRTEGVKTFITDFTTKFAIDNKDNFITPDNVFDKMTQLGEKENIARIDLSKIQYGATYNANDYKALSSYQGLAGVLNSFVGKKGMGIDKMKITVLNVSFDEKTNELTLTASAGIADAFKMDNAFQKIIEQIVPQEMFLNIVVNIKDKTVPAIICVNKSNKEETEAHFATIEAIMSSLGTSATSGQFSYKAICEKIGGVVNSAFADVKDKVGAEIEFSASGALIPNMFQLIAGLEQMKTDGKPDVTDTSVFEIFKAAYTYAPSTPSNTATDALALENELNTKFYLTDSAIDGTNGKQLFADLANLKNDFQTKLDMKKLAKDMTVDIGNNLKPMISEAELGYLIQSTGMLDNINPALKNLKISHSTVTPTEISLEITCDIALDSTTAGAYATLLPKKLYLQVNINIPAMEAKLADPTSVLPIAKFTINNMNDAEMADFITIMNKMAKLGFKKTDVENKLGDEIVKFMKDLRGGDLIKIVFETEHVLLNNTIFDIATKQIYKDETNPANIPATGDVRVVMQKMHTPTFATKGLIASGDINRAISEINSKYYINNPVTAPIKPGDISIMTQLSSLSANVMTSINGEAMASDKREAGKIEPGMTNNISNGLTPKFTGSELGKMIEESFTGLAANGLKEVVLQSLNIVATTKGDTMQLSFKVVPDVSGQGQYGGLIPQEIILLLEVDLSQLTPDKIADNTTICTSTTINGMDQKEFALFANIFQTMTKNTTFNPDAINKTASDQVKVSIGKITNGVPIKFESADLFDGQGGCVTLGSVFGIAVQSFCKGTTTTEREFQLALQQLFTPLELVGVPGANVLPTDTPSDKNFKVAVSFPNATLDAEFSERNIGAVLPIDTMATNLGVKPGTIALHQVALIGHTASDFANYTKAFSNYRYSTTAPDVFGKDSFLVVSYAMNVEAMIGVNTIMPKSLNLSYILDLTDQTAQFHFNNLSKTSLNVLDKMMTKNGAQNKIFEPATLASVNTAVLNQEVLKMTNPVTKSYTLKQALTLISADATTTPGESTLIRYGTPINAIAYERAYFAMHEEFSIR